MLRAPAACRRVDHCPQALEEIILSRKFCATSGVLPAPVMDSMYARGCETICSRPSLARPMSPCAETHGAMCCTRQHCPWSATGPDWRPFARSPRLILRRPAMPAHSRRYGRSDSGLLLRSAHTDWPSIRRRESTELSGRSAQVVCRKARRGTTPHAEASHSLDLLDLGRNIILMNRSAGRLLGLERGHYGSKVLGETFEIAYGDGRPMPRSEWPSAKAMRGEFIENLELRIKRLDSGVLSMAQLRPSPATRCVTVASLPLFDTTVSSARPAWRKNTESAASPCEKAMFLAFRAMIRRPVPDVERKRFTLHAIPFGTSMRTASFSADPHRSSHVLRRLREYRSPLRSQ
jgi:hypothetical protein